MEHEPIAQEDEQLAHQIIGAAIEVHRHLGPGFLESIYERAMEYELSLQGLLIEGQRLDLLVNRRVIVELKAVDKLAPIHNAQTLSYLKATGLRLGLLVNFNVMLLKNGLKRMVR